MVDIVHPLETVIEDFNRKSVSVATLDALLARVGAADGNPAANTLLAFLKSINTSGASVATAVGSKLAGTAAAAALLAGGVYNPAGITLTAGQQASLQFDSVGNLKTIGSGGGGSGGTQYAEDTAHTSGDLGNMALGVRKDTAVALANADGDYQPPIYDSTGRQWVHVGVIDAFPATAATDASITNTVGSKAPGGAAASSKLVGAVYTAAGVAPTNGQQVALQVDATGQLKVVGGGGGTQYTEDIAAAGDPIGTVMMGVRRDTLTAAEVSTDGDNIAAKMTSKGQLHVYSEISNANINGVTNRANSAPVTLAYDLAKFCPNSATTTLGTGTLGDILTEVLIIPLTLSPGAVSVKDGTAGTDRTIFAGGTGSVGSYHPFPVPFGQGAVSQAAGGWRVTCAGANVQAIAFGAFA